MTRFFSRAALFLGLTFSLSASAGRVYVGTYTGAKSKGIYVLDFDPATGKASEPRLAAEITSPSFIAIHPSQKYLYAVTEAGKQGAVSAFGINADGSLTKLNHRPSGGNGPCFVSTDPSGKVAMLANYGSGSFEALPINEDGSLGEPTSFIQDEGKGADAARQEGPHAHSINTDPAGHFAFGCDLGTNSILRFKLDTAKHTITPDGSTAAPDRAGPRHLVFHPNGTSVYVVNEMGSSVTAFHYDAATGALSEPQTVSTLPKDFSGNNTCAEVQIHPSGKFVYASNRGDDSIAVFSVDEKTGGLTPVGHTKTGGKTPRNFRLDPTGGWLFAANQDAGGVTVLKVNTSTGVPEASSTTIDIGMPVCVKFVQEVK